MDPMDIVRDRLEAREPNDLMRAEQERVFAAMLGSVGRNLRVSGPNGVIVIRVWHVDPSHLSADIERPTTGRGIADIYDISAYHNYALEATDDPVDIERSDYYGIDKARATARAAAASAAKAARGETA
jgi:hypothetical protein